MKLGILGAGTWGIALARMLSNSGHDVQVWSAISKEIDQLSEDADLVGKRYERFRRIGTGAVMKETI